MPNVKRSTRVLSTHKVEVGIGRPQRTEQRPYLVVQDILDFAKALEEEEAPVNEQVQTTLTDEDQLKSMGVYWSEDMIDGQPAPQAVGKDI